MTFSSCDKITAYTEQNTQRVAAKNCPLNLHGRKQQIPFDPNYSAFISGFKVQQEQSTAASHTQRAVLLNLPGKKQLQYNNHLTLPCQNDTETRSFAILYFLMPAIFTFLIEQKQIYGSLGWLSVTPVFIPDQSTLARWSANMSQFCQSCTVCNMNWEFYLLEALGLFVITQEDSKLGFMSCVVSSLKTLASVSPTHTQLQTRFTQTVSA